MRNGIISSFDTRIFSLDNICTNVSLKNNMLNKELILNSIYSGFDIIINIERQDNNKIKVTSIKEVDNNNLREVFSYSKETFNFNRGRNTVYKKIKNSGNNDLFDMVEGE